MKPTSNPILLNVEQSSGTSEIWGSVLYDDNLIVDSAKSVVALEKQFRKLLSDFHDVDPKSVKFEYAFDLSSLFEKHNFLNISAIAQKAGINPSLMRQYASGVKKTSSETAQKIEQTLREIAKELSTVRVGGTIKKELKRPDKKKRVKRRSKQTA